VRAEIHHPRSLQNQPMFPLLAGADPMTKWSKRSSVALDEETYEISRRVGNFSEFVRECLRRWNAFDMGVHIHPTETDKCFPMSKKGCCLLCWPDGPPGKDAWGYYRQSGGKVIVGRKNLKGGLASNPIYGDQPYANEWIEEKARELNEIPHFPIPKESAFRKSRKSPSSRGVKHILAKLWPFKWP